MIISVTERGTFRRCRRLWDYTSLNRQGLAPLVPSTALELGTLVHQALAMWLLDDKTALLDHFRTAALNENNRIIDAYKNLVGTIPTEEEMQPFFDGVELGMAMMQNYEKRWGEPLPSGFKLVYPEQEVQVAIPGTPHYLKSRLDGLVQDTNGKFYVLEHKTYGNRPNEIDLEMNDQFLAYLWILKQIDLGPIGGIAYDGMWKRAQPPKGSTLNDLFLRTTLYRNEAELEEFGAFLSGEAIEIALLMDRSAYINEANLLENGVVNHENGTTDEGQPEFVDVHMYPNRRWEGCRDCGFKELCLRQSRNEDPNIFKRTRYTRRVDDTMDLPLTTVSMANARVLPQ